MGVALQHATDRGNRDSPSDTDKGRTTTASSRSGDVIGLRAQQQKSDHFASPVWWCLVENRIRFRVA